MVEGALISDSGDPDERAVRRLVNERHDLVVVGGGIHGAFAAWQAARRGWRVALLEQRDFGSGTSANSLKIAHGGLRYLQKLDVRRLRASVRERTALRELAPALVRELPCLLPVHGAGSRSRAALALAMAANEVLSLGVRGSGSTRLPRGRTIGRAEYAARAREFTIGGSTGAALWHDALIESPERLLLAVVLAAEREGALVLNHSRVTAVLARNGHVTGVRVQRQRTGASSRDVMEVRSAAVLLTAGPWTGDLASDRTRLVRGCNVVLRIDRGRMPDAAVALPLPRENRMLFAVPWNGHLMVGTSYSVIPSDGDTDRAIAGHAPDVHSLLADLRSAVPSLDVRAGDVVQVHSGLLPGEAGPHGAVPLDRPILIEGTRVGGPAGLVVLQGVKWTTARRVSRQALDLCAHVAGMGRSASNGHRARPNDEHAVLVPEGDGAALASRVGLLPGRAGRPGDLASRIAARLMRLRGARVGEVLALAAAEPRLAEVVPGTTVLRAEVVHAIRREHARTLEDLVMRRLELGTAGLPDDQVLGELARVAADELEWNSQRLAAERQSLIAACSIAGASG